MVEQRRSETYLPGLFVLRSISRKLSSPDWDDIKNMDHKY